MKIPNTILRPIESTAANVATIFVISLAGGLGLSFLHGDLKGWADLPKALEGGTFIALMMVICWIGMASPLAKRGKMLLSSIRTDGTMQQVEVTGDNVTATVDATKITVKDAAK